MDHEPIVIYRSVNREGETFALKPSSRERLRVQFGDVVLGGSRIFIAHDTHGDFREMHGGIAPHVIQLLTGKAADALDQLGGVVFRDPVTEDDVAFAAA